MIRTVIIKKFSVIRGGRLLVDVVDGCSIPSMANCLELLKCSTTLFNIEFKEYFILFIKKKKFLYKIFNKWTLKIL